MSGTATETPAYIESFGCHLETEDGCDHPGDCEPQFYCGTCRRPVSEGPCPDHAPLDVPGLDLAPCSAEPRHPRTWFLAADGYPPPCMYCSYDALQAAHRGCEHSRHRAWRRWKVTHWLAGRGYSLGVVASHGSSYGLGCDDCLTGFRWGRSGYVLGRQREWWYCLIRRHHIMRPAPGLADICDICSPDPGWGDGE